MIRKLGVVACALSLACSDYKLYKEGDAGGKDSESGLAPDDTAGGSGECADTDFAAEEVGIGDVCTPAPPGGFTPIVEWDYTGAVGCLAQPAVGDLDRDGTPEIVLTALSSIFGGTGKVVALHGDGSGTLFEISDADMGYGTGPVLADLDDDGATEILGVREYSSSLMATGDYTAVAWDNTGAQLWESEHFVGLDFEYASAINVSDMDHDGSPEIVIGRVILNSDGTTRGVGEHGRGSYGITTLGSLVIAEASVSAVTDLDLDGTEEVVVGNAMYDPDGNTLWEDDTYNDGMVGIANLDGDAEGEFIAITGNTIRAVDTDGSLIWGPDEVRSANILSTPAIADLDDDGMAEIVVAGGNVIRCLNHDGTLAWENRVTDSSGATGASIFDFEGDGLLDVVYIDEVEMVVYDGLTGATKFYSTEHASNTMFDYPVVADVDDDDQAEIVVCHNGFSSAMSVYGDEDSSWPPARKVWNQHPYYIDNINDDLSVPLRAVPNFASHNTWHAGVPGTSDGLVDDVESEILAVCLDECHATGHVYITARLLNRSEEELEAGVSVALYARTPEGDVLLDTAVLSGVVAAGWSSEPLEFDVWEYLLDDATSLWLVADDDGTGTGFLTECSESNNGFQWSGPFCE